MSTLNAAPTTRLAALVDLAFDAGVGIIEAPLGCGFMIVSATLAQVTEWMNGVPANLGWMHDYGHEVHGARMVTE